MKLPPLQSSRKGTVAEKKPESPAPASNLMRVSVQVGDRRFDEDLAAQLTIKPDIDSLDDGLATTPARYGEWAMLEALQRGEVAEIGRQINVLDSDLKELDATLTLEFANTGTVDVVKARVTADPRRLARAAARRELEKAHVAAKNNVEVLKAGKDSMEIKKDCLLELARDWRQQMQTQLTVNAGKFRPQGRQ